MSEETTTQNPDENPDGKNRSEEAVSRKQYEDVQAALKEARGKLKTAQDENDQLKLQSNDNWKEAFSELKTRTSQLEEDLEKRNTTIGSIVETFKGKVDKKALELMPEGLNPQAELSYLMKSIDVFGDDKKSNTSVRDFRGIQNPRDPKKTSISQDEFTRMSVEERVKHLDEMLGDDYNVYKS